MPAIGPGDTALAVMPGPIAGTYADPELAAHISKQQAQVPAGRLGSPEEIAATVGFLVSPGGAYCTGQMLHINGGAMM